MGSVFWEQHLERKMTDNKKRRILIAKPGLDGHDRGALMISRVLRDEGFEVIYAGIHQTPEMIVQTAIQEGVDAIGISILSGAHMAILPKVIEIMKEKKIAEIPLFGGGIIPEEDRAGLKDLGVWEIFGPGTSTIEIIQVIKEAVGDKK